MKKIPIIIAILVNGFSGLAQDQESKENLPSFLKDRGAGIATSMFGTYIEKGEVMIYPFYEYYYDSNKEYKPSEFGYNLSKDYFSKSFAHEGLIFLGYGISDRFAIEMEAAVISETLYKSKEDESDMPDKISESGLGDVEGQIRYRWNREKAKTPEVYSYFETVLPLQPSRKLIGTQDWEFKLGTGIIKGFHFGTLTCRAGVEYKSGESKFDPGEYALEYLKRVSEFFRFGIVLEGSQDEASIIADLQFHLSNKVFIRLNSGFGITPKATDFTPETGVLFTF